MRSLLLFLALAASVAAVQAQGLLFELVSPSEQEGGFFGYTVSGVPDVDGDGAGDVIVGAVFEDPGPSPPAAGRAYVFSGVTGAPLHTLASPNEEPEGFFGTAVAGVGDVDGDGRGDVIVGAGESGGALNAGRAYVFSGATGILLHTLVSPHPTRDGSFGNAVAGVPDLDGDGRGDVVVGARIEGPGPSPPGAVRA